MRVSEPVAHFGTSALDDLVADLWDTMHARGGAGIAAPQIGVPLRVVVFGFQSNARYLSHVGGGGDADIAVVFPLEGAVTAIATTAKARWSSSVLRASCPLT